MPTMTNPRFTRLIRLMADHQLEGLAINPGPSLIYLTGLPFHLMERPTVLLITAAGQIALVLPELELRKMDNLDLPIEGFAYNDNPASWPAAFAKAVTRLNLEGKKIGVEPSRLRVLELRYLETAMPKARFISADAVFNALRIQKDADEVSAMRRAVQIAQEALKATLPMIHAGVTERAIAAELVSQLLKAGSDPELPFSPIVSSGPNSANPHASPSDRKLQEGDLLVIDWGAAHHGYISDLTRTFAIGEVDAEYRRIAETVLRANAAGRNAAQPESTAGSVDAAARKVILDAGYGEYFTHRTGHGIGTESHEPPYIFGENDLPLLPGMTFTVEPGIYLPGRGGVRIEDNVVITSTGSETLSDLPRELITLR
jgi:Xaa-Pro dipeptidase